MNGDTLTDGRDIQLLVDMLLADCNGSGLPDDEDISNGTSEDCNHNSIPDECDVAEGTSLDELKGHLSMLVRAESEVERTRIARLVDHQVTQLLPKERDSPVEVRIAGWPPGFSVRDQARFLADTGPLEALPPLTAARLIRDIDGVVVAGHRLCAQAVLNRGEILPSVPRAQRGRSRPQGQKSWLPHTDDVGRWSASRPEMTAQCIDAMADVSCVIDSTVIK